MLKIKTHSGAKKRFKLTKKGRIKYKKAGSSHLLTKKSSKRRRRLKKVGLVKKSSQKKLKAVLPYG